MTDFSGYVLLKLLPAAGVVAVTLYLVYVRSRPSLLNSKMEKTAKLVPKNHSAYGAYQNLYSSKSVAGWALVSSALILGLVSDYFKSMPNSTPATLAVIAAVQLMLFAAGTFMWLVSYRKI